MKIENYKSIYLTFGAIFTFLVFGLATFLTPFVATVLAAIGVFLFSKRKAVKWFTLAVTIVFNAFTSATVGIPVRYSYPMSGKVQDKLTGEPIENAIFECRWVGREDLLIGSHAGFDIDKTYAVTGKNGKYFLKGRWTFDLFYPTVSRYVTVRHPLYETLDSIDLKWDKLNEGDTKIHPKNGVIHYTIKLRQLKDKYREVKTLKETVQADRDLIEANSYSDIAFKIKPIPNIDWKMIFNSWESLVAKWPDNFVKETALKRINNTKNIVAQEQQHAD